MSDFFALLRYGYKLIAAGVIAGVALAAIAVFVVPKTYTATSVVTVNPIASDPLADSGGRGAVNTTTEAAILRSTTVAALAADELGNDQEPRELLGSLRVTAPRESEVLEIQFDAGSAASAANGANAFAEAYLAYRSSVVRDQATEQLRNLNGRIDTLEGDLRQIEEQIADAGSSKAKESESALQRQLVLQELSTLRSQESRLTTYSINAGHIIDQALPPREPTSPKALIFLGVGFTVGLLAGLSLALFQQLRRKRIANVRDVETLVGQRPLAILGGRGTDSRGQAQAYRVALTKLFALERPDSMLVTGDDIDSSAVVATGLAVALASAGAHTTLLLPHSPAAEVILRALRVGPRPLITAAPEAGDGPLSLPRPVRSEAIHRLSVASLALGGGLTGGMVKALGSERIVVAGHSWQDQATVLDVAQAVGGVILVLSKHKTDGHEARLLVDDLEQVGARLLGSLFVAGRPEPVPGLRPTTSMPTGETDEGSVGKPRGFGSSSKSRS
ncbi:Wzz/FepE/Etk N-terminal domain-containing protein [Tenggerimyces flavus]|uniref:Wzz/FepE/Etk N-terminal domain-containing protein n=1 Tax=Tenggerimyces flavus TaxID=1708749 RepID=A0ABV7Y806_9ACTN|nr:Wzz/FepE/Etk N-terminal domain-containing protein [Tenggerimyces flavus]MBM7785664.1 capsular polysaccharide biosynthesis protein [Tenggerimyces flavus]